MCKILKHRKFKVINNGDLDACAELKGKENIFQMVTCFNVLDRCDKPISLLRSIYRLVQKNGLVMIAVVLPFLPYLLFVFKIFKFIICRMNYTLIIIIGLLKKIPNRWNLQKI